MHSKKVDISLVFETSWEVCNKVGGIYTVLSTKAKNLVTLYKDKVFFIGPDIWSEQNPSPFFKESKTLLRKWKQETNLPFNISARVGHWEVPGRPIAILIKFDGLYAVKNQFYGEMWQKFGVNSLNAYGDYDEACAFSHAAGIVITSLIEWLGYASSHNVIAHFDEWTTGMGLLYLKDVMPNVATIFTTHATSIGRSICGNGKNLYQYFRGYNGDQMAFELNMEAKHSLEKTAARNADCFTTVSDITADECEQLLERRPNIVTPNGFEQNFVPGPRKFQTQRKQGREKLLHVATALTGNQFGDDTFIIATSGRCEYRNKGLDVFIDSITRLKNMNPSRQVLAFVMVPAWLRGPREDLSEKLKSNSTTVLPETYITHNINNPDSDSIAVHIRNAGFAENKGNNVCIIYVPCYLTGDDGIFDKCYYDLLIGMDATVFPSYYEPWGYTPLESITFGVPTITTSLSGFGRWILSAFDNNINETGVQVISRDDTDYHQTCEDISLSLKKLINLTSGDYAKIAQSAMKTSQAAAWTYFIDYYIEAFDIALSNAKARTLDK